MKQGCSNRTFYIVMVLLYVVFLCFFFKEPESKRTCTTNYSYEELDKKINTILVENNFRQDSRDQFRENKRDVDVTTKESYKVYYVKIKFNDTIQLSFEYSIYPFKKPIQINYGTYNVPGLGRYDRDKLCDEYDFCEKEALEMFENRFLNKVIAK